MTTGIWHVAAFGLQALADLEAVDARHHDVEQHEIDRGLGTDRQRVMAVARGDDIEIFGGQPRLEQIAVRLDVIDYQYARCHGTRSCFRVSSVAKIRLNGFNKFRNRNRF
jgi:hypothetical protein